METNHIEEIKSKATTSVVFLSVRNLGLQSVSFVGFFILTFLMGPAEVGLFAVVTTAVGILAYFSDFGLASALIQQKEEIENDELQTTFFIQQIVVTVAIALVALLYPGISRTYQWGQKELWITASLCFAFFVSSLKTIPSVLLERHLNYKTISTIDIIQNVVYYLVAVVFALFNFGAYSFAYATVFSSLLGLILIYLKSPWRVAYSFSLSAAKRLFKFGIPFQLNTFIAMAKDRLSTLLVAGLIGRESYGILSFAQKGISIPQSFMDPIMRVTFPAFSRLQDNHDFLKRSLERSIYIITFFAFPVIVGISLLAPEVISLIPKYTKWLPAIIPLYFFAGNAAIAVVTTPLTNAFNAVGKIRLTTKFMVMWTVLTWIFYPLLSFKFGYIGTAVATLLVGSSSFIVWYVANRVFSINMLKIIFHPLASSLIMIFALLAFQQFHLPALASVISQVLIGLSIYIIYHTLFSRSEISWFINKVKCLAPKK